MKPVVAFRKSRPCISVPAKYRPGTLTDSLRGVSSGKRPSTIRSGVQVSSKSETSQRNPVATMTRS